MQPLGPFVLNPWEVRLSGQPSAVLTIPVSLGQNSLIEILNYSTLVLQITIPGKGTVWQADKSNVMYACASNAQGAQTLTITALLVLPDQVPGHSMQQPMSADSYNVVFVNVYQGGEGCMHEPVSLAQTRSVPMAWFVSQTAPQAGPYTITLPTTATNYTVGGQATVFMTGYDIEISTATTASGGDLVISGFRAQDDGNTTMWHHYKSQATASGVLFVDRVRFPDPISNDPSLGTPIVCSIPGLGDAIIGFTAYYYYFHAVTL